MGAGVARQWVVPRLERPWSAATVRRYATHPGTRFRRSRTSLGGIVRPWPISSMGPRPEERAEAMGVPPETVTSHGAKARAALQQTIALDETGHA
jgi:hypothetical protein